MRTELVLVSAADEAALVSEINRLVTFLDRVPDVPLKDVAYTCSLTHQPCTLAIIASDVVSLRARLSSAGARIAAGQRRLRDKSGTYYFRDHLLGPDRGKLAFVYSGVMGFYPDMLRDLALAYPECRSAFDELEEALADESTFTPSSFIFPPASYYRHDADIFKAGAYAQALVSTYAACVALTRLMARVGVQPAGVVGFAGGDLAAMMRSGAAGELPSRPDRLRVIRDIYGLVHKAVNHGGFAEVAMVTVLLRRPDEIDELVRNFPPDKVMLAVDFSPRQKTYAIAKDFEKTAAETFAKAGIRTVTLALNRPFNTPLCEALVPVVRKFVTSWMKHDPSRDIYSCATATKVPPVLRAAREDTASRWSRTVRFGETVRQMYADGYRVFLEVGPRDVMTAAVEDTLRGEDHAALALNSIHRGDMLQLQHAVGQLVALGAQADVSGLFGRRNVRRLDFDASLSLEVRRDSEKRLSRAFPHLTLLSDENLLQGSGLFGETKVRGAKVAARAAAVAQQARRQRQFDFGALNPLVSDADTLNASPGFSKELTKVFRLTDFPFIGDYALGTSQMSYSDPNLRGLVPLTLSLGTEIMAELAVQLIPNHQLVHVDNLISRRLISFERGELKLFMRAERVPAASGEAAVKVQIRDDAPNAAYTWPVMEATFSFAEELPATRPITVEPLLHPRSVHWAGRDIYPLRLSYGRRLRGVQSVENWSETGLDYEIVVPPLVGNVTFTRFPLWVVNPLLLENAASGFALWRSHERFTGAFAHPFRLRRLSICAPQPKEYATLKCYMRLTGVTPQSHICDITVSDGNGNELFSLSGWEERTERVPSEYRALILQPASVFMTQKLGWDTIGHPATNVATAYITDVPYAVFERNEELWLRMLSHVVLDADERRDFAEMTGSPARRTEWLFGRVAAKESVRRYLNDYYQARWSDADVRIWPDDSGKPHALGAWNDYLTSKLDIAIAHTDRFIVAIAASNARVGVDVENATRDLSDEFANGVLTPEERELATGVTNGVVKFWCAKEAVSKALGTGIRYSPREMIVTSFQPDTGRLEIRLEGAWTEAFKQFTGRTIDVTVRVLRDHALASCFIPATLFNDED